MRSLGFTVILALLAVLVCGLSGWQWTQGNFNSVFGSPPVPVGKRIYTDFQPSEVKFIRVAQAGVNNQFELGPDGWQCVAPWKDRMDPRAAVEIINFTLGMRVEDFAPSDEIDAQKAGLKESGINIRIEGADHKLLAKYKLGRLTPWLATVEGVEGPVPTVFVQRREPDRRRYTYSCTGDITPLFRDGLKYLRDHRPLYFNPFNLSKIRIQAEDRELTLASDKPSGIWRITQPQELHTDPKAIKVLMEGLFKLQATKVTDRESVTLPPREATAKSTRIALTSFGSEAETVLDISAPEPGAADAKATVSNRPNTVFELPVKPEADTVSLADLPLAVNDLRDPTLANLDVKKVRSVLITPSTSPQILITRTPPQPWMATIEGKSEEANEERLFSLLKSMKEGRATGFETDAATDFTPWGLDKPFLKLQFLGEEAGQEVKLEFAFGIDKKGGYFANRTGTSTVMSIDPLLVASLPVKPFEWRASRLWSIDRTLLKSISIKSGSEPPLTLLYDDRDEDWKASRGTTDLTSVLVPTRATYLLSILEGLKVTRWLSPEDESAARALQKPSLIFLVIEDTLDDLGDKNGIQGRTVTLAPAGTSANPAFYYGRLANDPQPFLLDRDTYSKLATELLEKE